MIRELIDLQQRLQEAENLIQRLEDQLQHLIDKEHEGELRQSQPVQVKQTVSQPQMRPQYSYGARYIDDAVEGASAHFEPRDAAYCIGREGAFENYRRPV